ncbi:MAG: hypothetical protein NVSMB58_35700 [Terriglobales bacterium]
MKRAIVNFSRLLLVIGGFALVLRPASAMNRFDCSMQMVIQEPDLRDPHMLYAIRRMLTGQDPDPVPWIKQSDPEVSKGNEFGEAWLSRAKKWVPYFTAPAYGKYASADIKQGDILYQRSWNPKTHTSAGGVVVFSGFDRSSGTSPQAWYSVVKGQSGLAKDYKITLDPPEEGNSRLLRPEATLRPKDEFISHFCGKVDR